MPKHGKLRARLKPPPVVTANAMLSLPARYRTDHAHTSWRAIGIGYGFAMKH